MKDGPSKKDPQKVNIENMNYYNKRHLIALCCRYKLYLHETCSVT